MDYGKLINFKIYIRKCFFGCVLCLCFFFKCYVKFDKMFIFNEDKMFLFNEVKMINNVCIFIWL